jgi:tRNA threonylcarbamoyladenosine biosynthesis protein TsaE
MTEFVSKSLEDTEKIASEIVSKIMLKENSATVVGLYGELGAGKTTFMKYFAMTLGITEEVNSPTFVLMKFFEIPESAITSNKLTVNKLIHIDAYRLESGEELKKLGWDELLADPKNLICIEWPERVAEIMPEHFVLRFEHNEGKENERKISFA